MPQLALMVGLLGPIALPAVLHAGYPKMGSPWVLGLTNFATLLPMVGATLWLFHFPPPGCRALNPGAICDGIPSSAAWLLFGLASAVLAVWGLLASSVTTFFVFRKRK